MPFEYLEDATFDVKGIKEVSVHTASSGWSKRQATLYPVITADGEPHFRPLIIFRGKGNITAEERAAYDPRIDVEYNDTAYNNETLIAAWLDKYVRGHIGGRPALLIWDAFRSHKTRKVLDMIKEMDLIAAIIPGGLTGLIQPLDTHCNKLIKGLLRDETEKYEEEFEASPTFTKWTVSDKRIMSTLVAARALDRFYNEKKHIIQKSFVDLGLAIPPDGSQDHLIRIKTVAADQISFAGFETATNEKAFNTEEVTDDDALREFIWNYVDNTNKELKKICKARGLKGYSKLKKPGLIAKLIKADAQSRIPDSLDDEEVVEAEMRDIPEDMDWSQLDLMDVDLDFLDSTF